MTKEKKKPLTFEELQKRAKEYGETFRQFIEAITGKKDIKSKIDVLANPENLKSMSILSAGQARFISATCYLTSIPEWGGIFDGLKYYGEEIMKVSPSLMGIGREQVIRFVGALTESKLAQSLRIGVEKGEGETEKE